MGLVKYCLMCLGTKMKMYKMNSSMLTIYNELILTRFKLSIEHMHACYECAYQLHKYAQFKMKCHKAYDILWDLSSGSFKVTEDEFKSIDRKQNKLESSLSICSSMAIHEVKHQDCDSVEQSGQEIKKESSEEEQYEISFEPEENITPAIMVTNSYYNNNQSKLSSELKLNKKYIRENGSENIYVDDLEDELFNFNSNEESIESTVNNIKLNLNSEIDSSDKVDLESRVIFDVECIETNCESITLNKSPIKVDSVSFVSGVSKENKRKCVVQNETILSNKKYNGINHFIENIKSYNNGDDAIVANFKSEIKRNSKIPVQNKKDCRLTIESSFFKDHVKIIKLSTEDARHELLLRKESRNYKMNMHKCDLCYRGFISEATYTAHMKKHSLDYGAIQCDICQLSFSEKRSLGRHLTMCHTWKLLCKNCPYVCFNINQVKSHIQAHKGKKYKCKACEETFRFPNSLSTHMRLKHSMELVCEFCGSTFASVQGMVCHKRLRHRKETNEQLGPRCEECDVHFSSELAFKRHRVLCSRHAVPNGCVVCGETFSNRVELRAHSREHAEPATTTHSRSRKTMDFKPVPCELCNKELHSRKAYVKHMNSEHPQADNETKLASKCVCEVCGRMFRHRSFLLAHQRKHTDEKPFSCPHCGKKFKNAYAVKMHLPMHTNEYTFECHLCEKAFGDRGKLNRHVKAHLGIRPYKCSYCDKTFMFQCEERLHTKYVHCKEPYPKRVRRKRNAVKKGNIK